MYAIIDIETTGGSPVTEKITEIAIYIHDGQKVVNEYSTLINPEKKIPYYITQLTGITNSMVADAPKFYEVAKEIIELTQDKVFIAHNVAFDYNFVKAEFKHLGYDFVRDQMCTVQLSRKIIPGYKSYSLGKLCKELGIEINARHRASGDALATVKLFELLIDKGLAIGNLKGLHGIQKRDLHPNFDPDSLKDIPDEPGVYYFYNDQDALIYIGKSKNIRTRILSHFRNTSTKKAIEMRNEIADFSYELTGSELVALLKESHEIKQLRPRFNRAQRRASSSSALYHYTDANGYIRFEIGKYQADQQMPLCSFSSVKSAKTHLQHLVEKYNLCQKLCGLYKSNGACFHHEILECQGACIGKETPYSYNLRAQQVIAKYQYQHNSFFIIEHGTRSDELAIIMVDRGQYKGYGYIDKSSFNNDPEFLRDCIKPFEDNRDTHQIIRNYLSTGKALDIVPYRMA